MNDINYSVCLRLSVNDSDEWKLQKVKQLSDNAIHKNNVLEHSLCKVKPVEHLDLIVEGVFHGEINVHNTEPEERLVVNTAKFPATHSADVKNSSHIQKEKSIYDNKEECVLRPEARVR